MTTPSCIIFLDIDGVLLPFPNKFRGTRLFPDRTLRALAFVLSVPGSKLVLSSTWRVQASFRNQILDCFREYPGPLSLIDDFFDITDPGLHSERQHEIYEWLQVHNWVNKPWVALDDEELLEGAANRHCRQVFEGHVVKTDSRIGLTDSDAERAIQLLRNQIMEQR
jgi:hypothetical protein